MPSRRSRGTRLQGPTPSARPPLPTARGPLRHTGVAHGAAPGALAAVPDPAGAFVGGGGPAVVSAVASRKPDRIAVALAAIERTGHVHAALVAAGYAVDGGLIQAARLAPLPGDAHRLAGTNPVFLLWATTPGAIGNGAAP